MVQRLRMSDSITTDSHTIPLPSSHHHLLRRKGKPSIRCLIVGMLLIAFLLAGCGPQSSAGTQEEQLATTQKIALDYQNHHNLTQANSELEALEVANLNQWLLYVTETTVTTNSDSDSNVTKALVLLVTDLGLQSNAIHAYALQHNLIASVPALQPEVMVIVQTTPEAIAGASQADVVKILSDPAGAPVISDTIVTTSTNVITNTSVVTTNTDVVVDSAIVTPALSSPVTPIGTLTGTFTLCTGRTARRWSTVGGS